MAVNPYLPGLEPINTMNNPVWNPDTQQFEYGFGNSAKATQPGLPGWDIYDKPGLPSGYPGTSGSLNKRYASVPEGMRERISDATIVDERRLDPEGSYPMPVGRDKGPLQYRDPQQYYMENRPYDYDGGWRGPIAGTGRYPDDGGYVEYQERYPHPYDSWIGREYSQADLAEEADRKGFLTSSGEHNPMLQRALISQNRANLYDDQGIAGLDTDALEDERVNFEDALEREYALKKRIRAERSGPVIESDEEQYLDQGITSPNKWQKFLSKITRQPYRPAMGGAYGYSPAQLNKMNALGGFYSEPMRQYRRDMGRIGNMWQRQAQGKKIGETNLQNLLNQYGGAGGLSDRDLSTIGRKTFTGKGQAFEAKPSGTFSYTDPSTGESKKGYSGGRATGGYIRSGYSRVG